MVPDSAVEVIFHFKVWPRSVTVTEQPHTMIYIQVLLKQPNNQKV